MSQSESTMPQIQPVGIIPLPREAADALTASMQQRQPIQEANVLNLAPEEIHDTTTPKRVLANPDSLYKYISWENPSRTIKSYASVVGLLCAVHYLPLTQTGLKLGATAFGVVTAIEYAHRAFTPNTIMARLRPRQYSKIPEPVLNDTLKDIHDLVQTLVVEAQRVIFAERLDRTVAAFVGFTMFYWLVKVLSPFSLTLLGVTSIYAYPLIKSPHGRQVMEEAKVQAGQLGNAALETSQSLAADGRNKAAELSSRAQETAGGAKQRAVELTHAASQTASNAAAQTRGKASELTQAASQTVSNTAAKTTGKASELTQAASQTASNVTSQTKGKASELTQATSQTASNTAAQTSGTASNLFNATAQRFGKKTNDGTNKPQDHSPSAAETSGVPDTSIDSVTKTAAPDDFKDTSYALRPTSQGIEHSHSEKSVPRQFNSMALDAARKSAPGLRSQADQAGTTGIMGRPRGVPLADVDAAPGFGKSGEPAM